MKFLDKYLRDVRIARARPFVRKGDLVLDVGCRDGVMFRQWAGLIGHGIGIDPTLTRVEKTQAYELWPGLFPDALPAGTRCDAITMLAVLEHIQPQDQAKLAEVCYELLNDHGRIVVTVPSPRVDDILRVLVRLHLVEGMSVQEHYGFQPAQTPRIFPPPRFKLIKRARFQFGLNNLFVFEKS
jgi:2-polyprenyl-3-methyl-5-hydroxy-6-metoxy-1,4-benzoquinol methylase